MYVPRVAHAVIPRQAAEPPRRFRLAALLEGIHRLTWPQVPQHIRITVCVPEHLICTLPEMGLRRALWNLITNAWQALGNQAGEVIITAEAREGQLHITVADTGPGLPQDMLQALPRAPMTTKPEGSGLGLLQVRGYVEALGGQLLLANRPGGGAEITLTIPCEHALCEFQACSGTPG